MSYSLLRQNSELQHHHQPTDLQVTRPQVTVEDYTDRPTQTILNVVLACELMPNVMAAQLNIGGALCESYVIPFLVRRYKLSLTPTVRVPCSNVANIGERKTWTQSQFCTWQNSARGKSPRRSIYSVPVQETAKHRAKFGWLRRCSNEAKTRNPLKLARVPPN